MSETMKELLVAQQENQKNKIVGYASVALAFVSLISVVFVSPLFLIAVVGFPLLAFFVYFRRMTIEYEYTYLDKEIRIDRIYNMNKRKNVDTLSLDKIEIIAVRGSSSLSGYERRKAEFSDYSAGFDNDETKVYEVWYDGKRKILMSLNDDFLTPVVRFIPQKVKKQ